MTNITYHSVRNAGPIELRVIVRHENKFYSNLLVAGIYNFAEPVSAKDLGRVEFWAPALRTCLQSHPALSTVVRQDEKGRRVIARASHVDLRQHVYMLPAEQYNVPSSTSEGEMIAKAITTIINHGALSFFDTASTRPAWRIDIIPVDQECGRQRAFVSFTYSHTLGDGISGINFHRSLLQALRATPVPLPNGTDLLFETKSADVPVMPHLPVSLGYLLGPALGHYLPAFLSKLLGLQASTSGSDVGTWLGRDSFLSSSLSSASPCVETSVEILTLDSRTLSELLDACRKRKAKLTALLHQVIARCMSQKLEAAKALRGKTNFISLTPTNIRKIASVPGEAIGNIASATYTKHHVRYAESGPVVATDDGLWDSARHAGQEIAQSTSTLRNQPVGLLAWISDFDGWMKGQLGKPRDASWEVSNLMDFDGQRVLKDERTYVEKILFCAPADVNGCPLHFNTVSTKGGDLVICTAWQIGALGLAEAQKPGTPDEAVIERRFVQELLNGIRGDLKKIARDNK